MKGSYGKCVSVQSASDMFYDKFAEGVKTDIKTLHIDKKLRNL